MSMTVRELIRDLERAPPEAQVTVESDYQGEGESGGQLFSQSVCANGDLVSSWEYEE